MLRRCPAYGHCDNKQPAEGSSGAPTGPLHEYCDASTKNKHCANPKGGCTWNRFKQTFRDARCNAVGLYDQKWQCSYRSPSGADEQQAEAVKLKLAMPLPVVACCWIRGLRQRAGPH
jgi:hypothetical protein